MSNREKRLQKLRQNQSDVTLAELSQVLTDIGFALDHVSGSHHVFRGTAGDEVLTLVIPFARPLKPGYVRQALEAIDKMQAARVEEKADEVNEDDS